MTASVLSGILSNTGSREKANNVGENKGFGMYKTILISKNEQILLKQILTEYLNKSPQDSINIHILIRHICGHNTQKV